MRFTQLIHGFLPHGPARGAAAAVAIVVAAASLGVTTLVAVTEAQPAPITQSQAGAQSTSTRPVGAPPPGMPPPPAGARGAKAPPPLPTLPKDYVIGPEDVVQIVFWTAKEMSAESLVRPDGMISLPLINDVSAIGLTPDQLSAAVSAAATKFVRDPGNTVIVKSINSRRIHVVGEVAKQGSFPLGGGMTVLQAIGEAGGFVEGADKGNVTILRMKDGKQERLKFNYNEVVDGKKPEQNIWLLPGDTVIVR